MTIDPLIEAARRHVAAHPTIDEILAQNPFYPAKGLIAWWLRMTGFEGVTMPWRRVYLLPEAMDDEPLRRHEAVHLQQIARYGAWGFSWRYAWMWLRHGYWEHPFEREAREREHV